MIISLSSMVQFGDSGSVIKFSDCYQGDESQEEKKEEENEEEEV